jgi:hypothetical protein
MSSWTPSIVPADQIIYLVLDDFGDIGRCWREAGVEATDLATVITDMLRGEYNDPVRSSVSTRPRAGPVMFPRTLHASCATAAIGMAQRSRQI